MRKRFLIGLLLFCALADCATAQSLACGAPTGQTPTSAPGPALSALAIHSSSAATCWRLRGRSNEPTVRDMLSDAMTAGISSVRRPVIGSHSLRPNRGAIFFPIEATGRGSARSDVRALEILRASGKWLLALVPWDAPTWLQPAVERTCHGHHLLGIDNCCLISPNSLIPLNLQLEGLKSLRCPAIIAENKIDYTLRAFVPDSAYVIEVDNELFPTVRIAPSNAESARNHLELWRDGAICRRPSSADF